MRKIHWKSWASANRSESLQPPPDASARGSISSLTLITCPITPQNRWEKPPLGRFIPLGSQLRQGGMPGGCASPRISSACASRQMGSSAQFFLRTHLEQHSTGRLPVSTAKVQESKKSCC